MPGVFRPATFADVIGSMQDGIDAATNTNTSTSGTGYFAEDDETMTLADSATGTAQANPAWGAGVWSGFTWG